MMMTGDNHRRPRAVAAAEGRAIATQIRGTILIPGTIRDNSSSRDLSGGRETTTGTTTTIGMHREIDKRQGGRDTTISTTMTTILVATTAGMLLPGETARGETSAMAIAVAGEAVVEEVAEGVVDAEAEAGETETSTIPEKGAERRTTIRPRRDRST